MVRAPRRGGGKYLGYSHPIPNDSRQPNHFREEVFVDDPDPVLLLLLPRNGRGRLALGDVPDVLGRVT